jgi:hypothetical protein
VKVIERLSNMDTIRLKGHIDSEGILKIAMPKELADSEAELVIVYTIQPKERSESWEEFVNHYYGILADDPIERPEDLLPEIRDEIE